MNQHYGVKAPLSAYAERDMSDLLGKRAWVSGATMASIVSKAFSIVGNLPHLSAYLTMSLVNMTWTISGGRTAMMCLIWRNIIIAGYMTTGTLLSLVRA